MADKLADVINKVRKLLKLASNSDKPGEVLSAQTIAQQLITKYQIEEADLYGQVVGDDIISQKVVMGEKYIIDKATLLHTIAQANFCKVLRGKDYCMIYGYANDIALCLAMYDILSVHMVSQMLVKLDIEKERGLKKDLVKTWITSFFGGYCIGIKERLSEAKQTTINISSNSLALVLRDKQHAIEEFWQRTVKSTGSKRKLGSNNGYTAGLTSAKEADLSKEERLEK